MGGEPPQDEDHSYADAYGEDAFVDPARSLTSRTSEEESDDGSEDHDDDRELAEMFAKVQNIQQVEGIQVDHAQAKAPQNRPRSSAQLEVAIPDRHVAKHNVKTPKSSRSSTSSDCLKPPAASGTTVMKGPGGIITISRKALTSCGRGAHVDLLAGVKKPVLFQQRLLQTATEQPEVLEQLTRNVVAAAPTIIAKRIETLSQPKQSDSNRKFALDDEQKHCRFRVKKTKNDNKGRETYDDENGNCQDRVNDFLARMEATERNRQKKLEMTRGEKEYLANLNKKVCPKCDVAQSFTEYRDKKKRCQTCGSEFRVPQAWGDIGAEFISRICDDSRTRDERKKQIRAQVILEESNRGRVAKSSTQECYEKSIQQRTEHKTFLDRNYTALSGSLNTARSSMTKIKQAQLQLEIQLKERRSKLFSAAQPPIY